MKQRIAFIGHRNIAKQIKLRTLLLQTIKSEIDNGCNFFTMGTHGDFDDLALSACKELRRNFPNIEIEVVITSIHTIQPRINERFETKITPYYDVKTVLYEIEEVHYKRQITESNKIMIDSCDTLICYVDENKKQSGALTALKYAKTKGLRIINLFQQFR